MINNWLQSAMPSEEFINGLPAAALGKQLLDQRLTQRDLKKLPIAIIGIDAAFAKKTRESLYNLCWDFDQLKIADLGDIRNDSPEFVIPLLRELQASGIVPIIIGGVTNGFRAQYQAFQALQRQVSILMVDENIRFTKDHNTATKAVLDPAIHTDSSRLYHLSHIGSQRHLVDPILYQKLDQSHFDYIRLGDARHNLQELEPVIRDADLMGIELSAIKKLEAPAQASNQPSGFDLIELSQLCRYAGMSDKLSSFGVFGVDPTASEKELDITAAAVAQLIWYFLDGFANRKGDFPASTQGLVEYIVDLKDYNQITFWKSSRSGRWWIQAPADKQAGEERHRLIPCSYTDYLKAVEQEIPDRLIAAFRRYE